jgi:hypothetical protein
MHRCERCGSTRAAWFTPSRFGRQAGIVLCLDCCKLNVRTPIRFQHLAPAPASVRK